MLFSTVSITLGECSCNPWPRLQSHCFKIHMTLVKTLDWVLTACRDVRSSGKSAPKWCSHLLMLLYLYHVDQGRGCPWNFAEATDPGLSPQVWRCPWQCCARTPLETDDWKMCSIVPEHSGLTSLDLYSSIVNGAAGKAKNVFCRLPGKDSFSGKSIPESLSRCPSLYHTNFFSLYSQIHILRCKSSH